MTAPNVGAELVRQVKAEVLGSAPRGIGAFQAEVTAVEAVGGDGRLYASVVWQGQTTPVRFLANRDLTLAVGNRVVVHLYDTDPVIAYRLTA